MIYDCTQNFAIIGAIQRLRSQSEAYHNAKTSIGTTVLTNAGKSAVPEPMHVQRFPMNYKLGLIIKIIIAINMVSDFKGVISYIGFQIVAVDAANEELAVMLMMVTIISICAHMIFVILLLENTKKLFIAVR